MTNNFGSNNLDDLFADALTGGIIGAQSASLLSGNLGSVVVAGAARKDMEDIVASDVTLITVLLDASSSIATSGLEQGVRDGYNVLVDTFMQSKERDSIMLALWTFTDTQTVVHSYMPILEATKLDASNYSADGATAPYDTWCQALGANIAYAQQLRNTGTPCRSIVVVITDGDDCGSRRTTTECASLSRDLLRSEQFTLAFVGVGPEGTFRDVARSMGVPDNCIEVQAAANPAGLRKMFHMVSQSAIRASQAMIRPGSQAGFFTP
ncbi:MAG: VWA domain-containing protein [Candidatus Sericytochromatia bacterium]|nr:VWA domain-containing protein [Candidatus Sericytochromatia bacterium]